jgi:hypothetical protein
MTKFRQLKFDQMDAAIELCGLENELCRPDDENRPTRSDKQDNRRK